MSAKLLGLSSVVRCERERVYLHLITKSRAKLGYARMRLARAEVYGAPACVLLHWSRTVAHYERVTKYVVRRYRVAVAFGEDEYRRANGLFGM